jgi:hypothetical protein
MTAYKQLEKAIRNRQPATGASPFSAPGMGLSKNIKLGNEYCVPLFWERLI